MTRDEGDDGPLTTLLADRGFRVLHWPTIRFDPPEDTGPLEAAMAALDAFDWAVFTSPRAVLATVAAARGYGTLAEAEGHALPVRPTELGVAAVGESTAASLADAGWVADVVPETATGEALLAALKEAGVGAGDRVFFPASEIARDVVPDGLERLGANVTRVVAYRTVVPPLDAARCRTELESGAARIITFTSPSTVQNLQEIVGPELFGRAVRVARAVAIGPTTADAVRGAGFDDVAVAKPHSLEGLADRVAALARSEDIEEAT
ncbi:MAG: uroporphyrinogen-III synthase [Longimicrobiales bacterium]